MNPDYKPIPSSIIAEGTGFWNGAGDRGDMAMIAYGASRFALACGDESTAEELWKLIAWCLEYCRRKINPQGVVASDSDELEGRFPAGKANLATSSLYFDALNSAVLLGRELGKAGRPEIPLPRTGEDFRAAIERYFGARCRVSTRTATMTAIRCCAPGSVFRSRWASSTARAGTIEALFSPRALDGRRAGDPVRREDLLGSRDSLRAAGRLAAGETERAMDFLGQLLQAAPAGRACALSRRGVAGRQPAPPVRRERPVLPHLHGRSFRDSSDRPSFLRGNTPPATQLGSDETGGHSRLWKCIRPGGNPSGRSVSDRNRARRKGR